MKRRIAAEWEPVVGVIVTWPLHLPYTILEDFSREEQMYVMVESEQDEEEAKKSLADHGIHMEHTHFIQAERSSDAWWPRDWGPHPLFQEDKELVLASASFMNSDPNSTVEPDSVLYNPFDDTYYEAMEEQGQHMENAGEPLDGQPLSPKEDAAIKAIAPQLGFEYVKMPIVMTGGNIMSDGRGNMMSTAVLTNENRFMGMSDDAFFQYASEELGIDNYSILSNYEDLGIQHIDCLLKMIDEETLIVSRAPEDHPYHERYERIVNDEISKLRTCYGRPYKVYRVDVVRYDGDDLTAYANSYIMNKKVYVPMYGVEQDPIALEQWQEAMPGYEIKGFTYSYSACSKEENLGVYETDTGWAGFDVIHCRTKSVWDKDMLYMSVRRLDDKVKEADGYTVDVNIVDYSNTGLKPESLLLYWKETSEEEWKSVPLEESPTYEVYQAIIPRVPAGTTVEYYAAAADNSGRRETMPRVAPKGVYHFQVI